jgi:hypothetical protein
MTESTKKGMEIERRLIQEASLVNWSYDEYLERVKVCVAAKGDEKKKIVDDIQGHAVIWPMQVNFDDVDYKVGKYTEDMGLVVRKFKLNEEDWYINVIVVDESEKKYLKSLKRGDVVKVKMKFQWSIDDFEEEVRLPVRFNGVFGLLMSKEE